MSNDITASLSQLAASINAEHDKAQALAKESLTHAKTVGELLLQAKEQVKHGEWLPWLKEHCRFSERTAQAYMKVARHWQEIEAKSATVADLTYRDATALLTHKAEEPKAEGPKIDGPAVIAALDEITTELEQWRDGLPDHWVYLAAVDKLADKVGGLAAVWNRWCESARAEEGTPELFAQLQRAVKASTKLTNIIAERRIRLMAAIGAWLNWGESHGFRTVHDFRWLDSLTEEQQAELWAETPHMREAVAAGLTAVPAA